MTFSQTVYQQNQQLWQASIHHPFISALSQGTMTLATFRYYLIQDHYYLHDFAKLHEMAAQATQNSDVKNLLLELAASLHDGEIETRKTFFEELHITQQDLDDTPIAPTAYAYTSHMYRTLAQHGAPAAIAGLLPCAWLYADIGAHLDGIQSPVPIFQAWIDSYQSDDYTGPVAKQIKLTDAIAAQANVDEQADMQRAFARSTYYEHDFWQMALDHEAWR